MKKSCFYISPKNVRRITVKLGIDFTGWINCDLYFCRAHFFLIILFKLEVQINNIKEPKFTSQKTPFLLDTETYW